MMKREKSLLDSLEKTEQAWLHGGQTPGLYRTHRMSVEEVQLKVVEGPHEGLRVRFENERIFVGREPWCDVALPNDKRISRNHCELAFTSDGIVVRDMGSRNGVSISDVRVHRALWVPGQLLRLGDSVLSLTSLSGKRPLLVDFFDQTGRLVGESDSMRSIFSMLARLRLTDVPVLLKGETGTGKTSIAQALHEQSPMGDGPFVQINCGAMAPSLVESELFGYEKGAFTSANKTHKGYLEQAHGGTLFLDEIGELPLELQPKLLDVLERKKVRRLGSEREYEVDFRLISATHRDLERSIQERTFREDLFYRLAVVELDVPSLRERRKDIPLLVLHFLAQLAPERRWRCSPAFLDALEGFLWPGNVRQLRNVIQRSLVFADGDLLDEGHLPAFVRHPVREDVSEDGKPVFSEPTQHEQSEPALSVLPAVSNDGTEHSLSERVADMERQILLDTLQRHRWKAKPTIAELGISRGWLYRLMNKHGIERP